MAPPSVSADLPADGVLTEEGFAASGPAPVRLIACGALAREILALIDANGWTHLQLTCLPAKLHNVPDQIPEAVRARIKDARAEGISHVFVVYADCGTGGLLDTVCQQEGVARIAGPHCYSFFDGNAAFRERADEEIGAFYLTDFLARQFDTLIWHGFGMDRHPELRDMMFANYDRVVYLAQTDDPDLTALAEGAAAKLGLRLERRFTGYGDLADALGRL